MSTVQLLFLLFIPTVIACFPANPLEQIVIEAEFLDSTQHYFACHAKNGDHFFMHIPTGAIGKTESQFVILNCRRDTIYTDQFRTVCFLNHLKQPHLLTDQEIVDAIFDIAKSNLNGMFYLTEEFENTTIMQASPSEFIDYKLYKTSLAQQHSLYNYKGCKHTYIGAYDYKQALKIFETE